MSFTIHEETCLEHPDCTRSVCVTDDDLKDQADRLIHPAGTVVWESHQATAAD